MQHGRRTGKTSFKGEGGAQAVAFGDEKAAPFCLCKLWRAEAGAPRLQAVLEGIEFRT